MKLSLSPSVSPFVPFFVLIVSFEFYLSSPKEFQWCFKKDLRVFEVSRMFQVCFKGVPRKILGCFKEVSRVFQESFKDVSSKF